jgi:hypothetical protein
MAAARALGSASRVNKDQTNESFDDLRRSINASPIPNSRPVGRDRITSVAGGPPTGRAVFNSGEPLFRMRRAVLHKLMLKSVVEGTDMSSK